MNMKSLKLLIYLLLITSTTCFAQKEGNNWYFGDCSALTFNTGKPVALKNSNMYARYGCATISSAAGRLLLYTDGRKIYDSSHVQIPGFSFNDAYTCTQSSLIVPWPDSAHLYYIFTPSTKTTDSIKYTVVNMKLRGGKGDVVSGKTEIRLPSLSAGKVNAIRHPNRRDYWVAAPIGNTDSIIVYLITPIGISKQTVKTKTGFYFASGGAYADNNSGYFKFSPDGRKLCVVILGDSSVIADFDGTSGKLSNIWGFNYKSGSMGVEFSAKSKYLYVGDQGRRLSQYDLTTKDKVSFNASRKTIDSATEYRWTCFQLARDGKIYITEVQNNNLHTINAPDSFGKKAHFEKNVVALNTKFNDAAIHVGLPDMVQSFFQKKYFDVKSNCRRDTTFFKISNTYELDSAHWDFDDPGSGTNNYSTKTVNVFHNYKLPGTYKARLVSFHKIFSDTIYESLVINYAKPFLGNDTTVCKADYIGLIPKGEFVSYKWSTGQTIKNIFAGPGTYRLTATDYDGCVSSDTLVIKASSVKAAFDITDSSTCFKSNFFCFRETSKYTNDTRQRSVWILSDSSSFMDSLITKSFFKTGAFEVKLVSESQLGCKDSISKAVKVYENTNIGFSINQTDQCLNTNNFNYVNTSVNSDSLSYHWDLGDINSFQKNYFGKTYTKPGLFQINLITTSSKNCKDTLTKSVVVLPSPVADFTFGKVCSKSKTFLTFIGSEPNSPVTTSYLWRFPDSDSSTSKNPGKLLNQPGKNKIKLEMRSSNGCKSEATKDVDVLSQAKSDFTVNDVCEDSSAEFINKSKDGINYNWKFGDGNISGVTSPKHQYNIGGITQTFNVTLVAIVPNGCSDSITRAVTINANPKSDFNFTIGGNQVSFTASENGATNYQWTFGDGGTASTGNTKTSYTYSKFPSGKYTVCLKVTNAANCFSETCKEVNIAGATINLNKVKGIRVYPNPNHGTFTMDVSEFHGETQIEILNQLGQIIHKQEIVQTQVLNLNFSNGVYLIRITSDGLTQTGKIVIQH
jgi:hypothetical protein